MGKMKAIIYVLMFFVLISSYTALFIRKPEINGIVMMNTQGFPVDVAVQLEFNGAGLLQVGHLVCIRVRKIIAATPTTIATSCFPINTETIFLKEMSAGSYVVTAELQALDRTILDSSQTNFVVLEFPSIILDEIACVYFESHPVLCSSLLARPIDDALSGLLELCITVLPNQTDHRPQQVCNSPIKTFLLVDVSPGSVKVVLNWKSKSTGLVLSEQSVNTTLRVVSLEQELPVLMVADRLVEVGLDSGASTASALIPFSLQGSAYAVAAVAVCASVLNHGEITILSSNQKFIEFNAPVGNYVVVLSLCLAIESQSPTLFRSPAAHVNVVVHSITEFVASYEWQHLKEWHTAPSGLEIRLPLGGSGLFKEARIADPFRLQLAMPAPCKYFLRMDVYKTTTLDQIRWLLCY